MKFIEAWGNVLTQNVVLRSVIALMGISLVSVSYISMQLALKEPLIIDRGCFAKSIKSGTTEVSPIEMEAFISIALSQRFDTNSKPSGNFF